MAGTLDRTPWLLEPARVSSLMEFMRSRGVVAFRVRTGEEELEVRWPDHTAPSEPPRAAPMAHATLPSHAQTLHAVTSPTVGTYFASPEPGKPPFVEVGQRIEAGDVVCVVESMKLMNEIEADASGVVVELPIPNGGSVKAGEVVCLLRLDVD